MNNWHDEYTAEYNRQRIRDEVKRIRLEELARQFPSERPRLFEQTMFSFANWMITTGKQLRKRYEIPDVHCGKSPTRSFAR